MNNFKSKLSNVVLLSDVPTFKAFNSLLIKQVSPCFVLFDVVIGNFIFMPPQAMPV